MQTPVSEANNWLKPCKLTWFSLDFLTASHTPQGLNHDGNQTPHYGNQLPQSVLWPPPTPLTVGTLIYMHMHTHAHTCVYTHAQCVKYQNAIIWMIMWHIAPYLSIKYTLQIWPHSWPVPHLFKPKSLRIYFAPHWKILYPAFPLSAPFFAYIFQINFLNQLII